MTVQNSELVRSLVAEETAYGTTPAAAGQIINSRPPTFTRNRRTETPPIARGDFRQYADVRLAIDGSVTFVAPLQYGNFLLFDEMILGTDESADYGGSQITISFDGTAGTIDDATNTPFGSVQIGDFIRISAAGNAANQGWKGPVSAAAAGSISVPAAQVVDEVAGSAVTFAGKRIVDGTLTKSASSEWESTQLANQFDQATGLVAAAATFSWKTEGFAEESYDLMGQEPAMGNATIFTGAPTVAPTTSFHNTLGDVANITINGTATSIIISSLRLTQNRNPTPIRGIAQTGGPVEYILGPLVTEVQLSYFFDTNGRALQDAVDAFTTTGLYWATVDEQGNEQLYHVPSAKPIAGEPRGGGGRGEPMVAEATFRAFENTTYSYQFAKFRADAP